MINCTYTHLYKNIYVYIQQEYTHTCMVCVCVYIYIKHTSKHVADSQTPVCNQSVTYSCKSFSRVWVSHKETFERYLELFTGSRQTFIISG